MLQIITGKFFKSDDRYRHDGKGILYSNYHWVQPVKTVVGALEPIDLRGRTASYIFSYVNQIEKEHGRSILVRTGDGEVVEQFRLLCGFGLRGCFADDRIWVEHLFSAPNSWQSPDSDHVVPSAKRLSRRTDVERDRVASRLRDFVVSLESLCHRDQTTFTSPPSCATRARGSRVTSARACRSHRRWPTQSRFRPASQHCGAVSTPLVWRNHRYANTDA
jgi:hypothetical protein